MKPSTTALLLFSLALLGGCASPLSLVPGQSTDADARARMGAPTATRVDRNGDRILEYATGPEGTQTYMVRVGSDGRVREVTQVLTDEQLAKVIPGKTTKSEVRELLGQPSDEAVYPVGLTWSWRYKKGGTQPGYLVVTFQPNDTVRDKIAIIDMPGDGNFDN